MLILTVSNQNFVLGATYVEIQHDIQQTCFLLFNLCDALRTVVLCTATEE